MNVSLFPVRFTQRLRNQNTGLATLFFGLLCITGTAGANNYAQHPQFSRFVDEVVSEGIYPKHELIQLMQTATRKESILEAIARPAEKTLTWAEYRNIFLTEDRINKGIEFYHQHKATFQKAAQESGVPEEMLLAILGVETRYGKHRGGYRVVDALATLGFDYPPRAKFFRKQLKEFLRLEKEAGIDLASAKGSYAGAMGYPQFIPSSYRHYAVDFDGDKKIDLIDNPADAIGSIANYFKVHGWKKDAPVTTPARFLPQEQNAGKALDKIVNKSLKPKHRVRDFTKLGLVPDLSIDANEKATAMLLQGADGEEYWIGLTNFYVITRYNHSHLYAMAAYQLSQALKEKMQ